MGDKFIDKELLMNADLATMGVDSWISQSIAGKTENVGEFKAGIRTNIDVTDVLHNEERGTLDIIMVDEQDNKCYVSLFPPNMEYCQDHNRYKQVLNSKKKLMYSILCLPSYPKYFNPTFLQGLQDNWDDMCEKIASEFTDQRDKMDQLLCAGVFTYNNKGYVGLRQGGYKENICTMAELRDLNITADKYFVTNPAYDKFENPIKYAKRGEIFSKHVQEDSHDDLPF